jgi:hypothetical protein
MIIVRAGFHIEINIYNIYYVWNASCTGNNFRPQFGPGDDSASNRNEYQESSWGVMGGRRKADNFTAICDPIV